MAWTDDRALPQDAAFELFGRDVTYTPSGGSATTIRGIFRDAETGVDDLGLTVSTNQPILDVRGSDIPSVQLSADTFIVDAVSYSVADVLRDGEGLTRLRLVRTN